MDTRSVFAAFILLGIWLQACDPYKQDSYVEQVVVDAYLIAGESLPYVRLTTTAPINEVFTIDERGVAGASVVVTERNEQNIVTWSESYNYHTAGFYHPGDPTRVVQPRYRYDLLVTLFDGAMIRAHTVVPDTFIVLEFNTVTLPYQSVEQFTLRLSRSFYPGRNAYYIFSTETLDPENAEFTPFYAEIADDREDFYIVSSGIVNESSSISGNNGDIELVYPWIGLAFLGENRVTVSAIDNNIYDFVRSAGVQLGGSTQSPGEIENVIYNIDGGIGVFGSYARISIDINVLPPQF